MNRRDFLKLAVGSASGIALASSPFALVFSKNRKEQEGAWKEIVENWKFTTCNLCPAGCGAVCRVIDGKAVRVAGNPAHPVNKGALCPKGLSSLQLLYHPSRLHVPMKKEGNAFRQITWTDALAQVTESLASIEKIPHSLLFLRPEGFSLTDRLAEHFMSSFGSPNLLTFNPSPYLQAALRLTQGWDGIPAYDFKSANYILSFGTSLFEGFRSPVYAMQSYGYLRQERAGEKAKIVQVEPRFSTAAGRADEFVAVAPGTEGLLALGMAYVLVKEELYDRRFVEKLTFGFDDFRDEDGKLRMGFKNFVLKEYPVDFVSQVTGVPVDTILRISREFAVKKPSIAIADTGSNDYSNATFNAVAVHCLNALTGSIDVPGGIQFQESVPFRELPQMQSKMNGMERLDRNDTTLSLTQNNTGAAMENIIKGKPYNIKAVFIQNTNPVFLNKKWGDALGKIPFKVSFSSFMDETSALCDLVLPDLTFLEKWDAVSAPSVGFPVAGVMQPAVKPPAGSLSPADFLIELMKNLKAPGNLPYTNAKEMIEYSFQGVYEAKRGTPFAPDFDVDFIEHSEERGFWYPVQKNYKEFFRELTKSGGWFDPRYVYENWGMVFQTPSGKFEFYLRPLKEKIKELTKNGLSLTESLNLLDIKSKPDYAYLPHFETPRFAGNLKDFPYLLMVYKTLTLSSSNDANIPYLQEIHGNLLNSQWDSFVEINPETAKHLGVHDGDKVYLETKNKRMPVTVRVFKGIPENTVAVPLGQGHEVLKPVASGIGSNPAELVVPEQEHLSGGSPLTTTRVKIRKA